MKTAMQELIEYLDDTLPKSIKEQYLQKEKEQIIDDFETGKENAHYSITNPNEYIIGEFYYNQKYNQ
jgi:hypothetical protein